MPEPTRSLRCAVACPASSAPGKLYSFAIKAMALLAPSVHCRLLNSTETGEMPWDFRRLDRYGTESCGFEIKTAANAFDTSAGIKESFEVSVTSVGLPGAAAFHAGYFRDYDGAARSISATFDVPPAHCDDLALILLYAFDT